MTNGPLYTDRKVYCRLAEKLPAGCPTTADWIRFSVEGDTAAVAAQRGAHLSIYAGDPRIAKITAIPGDAWDPAHPKVGARYGIVWLTLADLHHNARGDSPVVAVVMVDDLLFLNITMSTTTKHIRREDGEDENGVTRLMLGVLNHYPSLRESRFAEDVTRAGRDAVDWAAVTGKHRVRDINMVFGGQSYRPSEQGGWVTLSALGLVAGNDDPMRRHRMTGKRLTKYASGGAAIAERQMPQGWAIKKDEHGRAVIEGERGRVPDPEAAMAPVIQSLYAAHAAGESYQRIFERMLAFEAAGVLRRRDHTDPANTYAAAEHDPVRRYDSAKSFFVRTSFRPATPPAAEAVTRYLGGEDPADVFDADTRLYIAKVELIRTGRYFRRLRNDIRGRNIVLNGIPAVYRDDRDEYGWFDVLSAAWAWPLDGAGATLVRFGVPDEVCRRSAARLLEELRDIRPRGGGRSHRQPERRALQNFASWVDGPEQPTAHYTDEGTQWGVEARRNNSGKFNFILLFRRESDGMSKNGQRGWSFVGPGEKRSDHILATGSLAELCASVAHQLNRALTDVLSGETVAALKEVHPGTQPTDPTTAARLSLENKQGARERLLSEAEGHRTMAALTVQAGGQQAQEEAMAYSRQAGDAAAAARRLEADIVTLQAKLDRAQQDADLGRQVDADVSVAAYIVAGLEKAARGNGCGPARLGQLCDEILSGWRMVAEGESDLRWSCTAALPLVDGGHAQLPIAGVIRNVRTRPGRSMATSEIVARYLFEEGRDLDDLPFVLESPRRALLTVRVMPWLREHGVTARGAKCALVDHPVAAVRRELFRRVSAASGVRLTLQTPYVTHLAETYLDPDLQWGDAAVPDDTVWVQAALDLLTASREVQSHGLPVLDLALALGRSEHSVRELVKPQRRVAGFTRPRYLAYADASKSRVVAIPCPHDSCRGRRAASHVVLLPEVAASGYGTICPSCRRAPVNVGPWGGIQFPGDYLARWTNAGESNLRTARQTVLHPTA